MIAMTCVHCGADLAHRPRWFSYWKQGYQCAGVPCYRPGCDAGKTWYREHIDEDATGGMRRRTEAEGERRC